MASPDSSFMDWGPTRIATFQNNTESAFARSPNLFAPSPLASSRSPIVAAPSPFPAANTSPVAAHTSSAAAASSFPAATPDPSNAATSSDINQTITTEPEDIEMDWTPSNPTTFATTNTQRQARLSHTSFQRTNTFHTQTLAQRMRAQEARRQQERAEEDRRVAARGERARAAARFTSRFSILTEYGLKRKISERKQGINLFPTYPRSSRRLTIGPRGSPSQLFGANYPRDAPVAPWQPYIVPASVVEPPASKLRKFSDFAEDDVVEHARGEWIVGSSCLPGPIPGVYPEVEGDDDVNPIVNIVVLAERKLQSCRGLLGGVKPPVAATYKYAARGAAVTKRRLVESTRIVQGSLRGLSQGHLHRYLAASLSAGALVGRQTRRAARFARTMAPRIRHYGTQAATTVYEGMQQLNARLRSLFIPVARPEEVPLAEQQENHHAEQQFADVDFEETEIQEPQDPLSESQGSEFTESLSNNDFSKADVMTPKPVALPSFYRNPEDCSVKRTGKTVHFFESPSTGRPVTSTEFYTPDRQTESVSRIDDALEDYEEYDQTSSSQNPAAMTSDVLEDYEDDQTPSSQDPTAMATDVLDDYDQDDQPHSYHDPTPMTTDDNGIHDPFAMPVDDNGESQERSDGSSEADAFLSSLGNEIGFQLPSEDVTANSSANLPTGPPAGSPVDALNDLVNNFAEPDAQVEARLSNSGNNDRAAADTTSTELLDAPVTDRDADTNIINAPQANGHETMNIDRQNQIAQQPSESPFAGYRDQSNTKQVDTEALSHQSPPARKSSHSENVSGRRTSTRIQKNADEVSDKLASLQLVRESEKWAEAEQKRIEEEERREAQAKAAAEAQRLEAERLQIIENERRSHRNVPSKKIITPISQEWAARLARAMESSQLTVLAKSPDGTEIKRRDFGTLLPQEGTVDASHGWLNDEIILASLNQSVNWALEKDGHIPKTTPKYHVFSSFFYKNLREKGPEPLKRWTVRAKLAGEKLFGTDYVFIPVNNASHWTLIVVSPSNRTVEYFDSFGGDNRVFLDNARKWLQSELGALYKHEEWKYRSGISPRQTNASDCGVFTITNARMVLLGFDPEKSYDRHDMQTQRERIACELIGGLTGEFEPLEFGWPGVTTMPEIIQAEMGEGEGEGEGENGEYPAVG